MLAPLKKRVGSVIPILIVILTIVSFVHAMSQNSMVLFMDIISPGVEVRLPLGDLPIASLLNVTVDWGDWAIENFTSDDVNLIFEGTYYISHPYANVGTYMITVDRRGPGVGQNPVWLPVFGWSPSPTYLGWSWNPNAQLLNITSFGDLGTTSLRGCFLNVVGNVGVPGDIPRSVINLSSMFLRAGTFNRPIDSWNVSNVQYMENMFQSASAFNQPLLSWNVRSVFRMSSIFEKATAFNQPLNTWRTDSLRQLTNAFFTASSFNQPLDAWNVSQVTHMDYMFSQTSFNQDLSTWDVSNVINFDGMFYSNVAFNYPLDSWRTVSATSMSFMFAFSRYNLPLSSWDVSKVVDFSNMFQGNPDFNQQLDSWQPLSATTMSYMFASTFYNQPMGSWNVSAVTDFSSMFRDNINFNQPLGTWDMRSARSLQNMFYGCRVFNYPLSSWNTTSVIDMQGVFTSTSYNAPLDQWNVASVMKFDSMFAFNFAFNQPLNNWKLDSGTTFTSMFENCTSFNQPLDNWNTRSVINMDRMFVNAAAFNQPLTSWCVPLIPSRPTNFANNSALPAIVEPIWGTCPIPPEAAPVEAPIDAPADAPLDVPLATPADAPIDTPADSPATVPLDAPIDAPKTAPIDIGCTGQVPTGNVSCIDGRWIIYQNSSSVLTAGNSSVVTIQPNTTIVITDPVVAENVTIIITFTAGSTLSSAGTIQVSDCITLGGAVVIQLSNSTSVSNNDRIPIISSTRPDCFNVNVTTSVQTDNAQPCAPAITGAPSVDSRSASASLSVFFTVTSPSGDPACSDLVPSVSADSAPFPVAVIGGVIGGAVALVLIIAVTAIVIKKRQFARETARVRKQVLEANRL